MNQMAVVAGCLGLMAPLALAQPLDSDHSAPVASLAASGVSSERQKTLSEMWQRRIIAVDADHWTPEDMTLLLKVRTAETAGALTYLRDKMRTVAELAVVYKTADGVTHRRLTKEGFDKYLFLKTQDAILYFENKDVDAKWVFQLVNLKGKPLFGADGMLTPDGDALYSHAAANQPTFWKTPNGEVRGNRRPPPIR